MDDKRFISWYMVSTISGKEENVYEDLEKRIKSFGYEHLFDQIKIFKSPFLSPRELEKKRLGEKYTIKEKNMFKGYIFVKMLMTDEAWFLVRNTQYVTGLIGSSGKGTKPIPISDKKIAQMFENEKRIREEFQTEKEKSGLQKGMVIEIVEGDFRGEEGIILEVDETNKVVFIERELFGKKTTSQFDFTAIRIKHDL